MFARWINIYKAWRLESKLEHYELVLQNIDVAMAKPEEYPVKLKEFWRLFDMSLLDGLTVRDVMGHSDQLRHRNFGQLNQVLLDGNDAIAQQNDSRIEYVIRNGLHPQTEVDLEHYFIDPVHGQLNVRECFDQLLLLLQAHCGIVENIDDTYGQRKMLYVYYDILKLSELMLDVIEARGIQ